MPIVLAFPLACILALIEIILEKAVFYFTSMYVQSMPEFTYDPTKWVSMAFGVMLSPQSAPAGMVGLVFDDPQYAEAFFKLLRSWSHRDSEDLNDNIKMTFVLEEDLYCVYLYPNPFKASIMKFFDNVQEKSKLTEFGKEHLGLVVQMQICKAFSRTHGDGIAKFAAEQRGRREYFLVGFVQTGDGKPARIADIEPIRMTHLRALNRSELCADDLEYQVLKKMGK
jgi:hypothetical protein